MIDHRLLQYCTTERQVEIVEAVLDAKTHKQAAEKLGINVSNVADCLARVKANANKNHDFLQPLVGQSRIIRGKDGEFKGWDITRQKQVKEELWEEMKAGLDVKMARPKKAPRGKLIDVASALTIADPHIGMLAYGSETGDEDYNNEIAVNQLVSAIDNLLPASHKAKHGILLNLGDAGHRDGKAAVTNKSRHLLDVSSNFSKMARDLVRVMIYAIDRMLERFETVEGLNVQGNHDENMQIMLNILLQHYYANEPRVHIQDNDCLWLTHRWEKNFIHAYHGHGIKKIDAYIKASNIYAKEFAECNYVWMPSGHIHNEQIMWRGRAKLETMTTLAPTDMYHAAAGYGSHREMVRTDLHPQGGRIGCQIFDPVLHKSLAA